MLLGMIEDALPKPPKELNALLLAYVGDAVYELYVRYHLLSQGMMRPNDLQKRAVRYVSATAQAEVSRQIQTLLTEEEQDILRRGRNMRTGSVPKHVSVADYRASTGLEALIGFWYLSGDKERLNEMMKGILERVEEASESGK